VNQNLDSFLSLSPDRILDIVEAAAKNLGYGRASGYCLALNSLENRVFEIDFDNGSKIVAKFYRPGRWSREQLQEEHDFLNFLLDYEVPVVAPLEIAQDKGFEKLSSTLGQSPEGIFFVLFPKVRGRIENELNQEQLQILGRYLARIHSAGAAFGAQYRWKLDVQEWIKNSLQSLKAGNFLENPMAARYLQTVATLEPLLKAQISNLPLQAIHGDCHLGNTLWFEGKPFFLDFDDMMQGPPVQDIWMIVRGRDEEALKQRETLLESYELMRPFDRSSLDAIEALRALIFWIPLI
jgi:Ser/Thr protein kinase RdoA (MazF antagonist)